MNNKKWFWLFAILLIIDCAGTPQTNLYLLHPKNGSVSKTPSPVKVGIYPFKIDPVFTNPAIAIQYSEYEIQFYHYHRWATNPATMINGAIGDYLKASNRFSAVLQLPATQTSDIFVRGTIHKFVEWREGDRWFGLLKMDVSIFRTKDGQLLWRGSISKKVPAEKRNPLFVVKALSKATQEAAEELAGKILGTY
ncbi:MAG TPA: hypothetical protein ENH29_00610 [Bacteroidetes bacterium]|nr:hypothetical protein [Bacteroidota bacterium]